MSITKTEKNPTKSKPQWQWNESLKEKRKRKMQELFIKDEKTNTDELFRERHVVLNNHTSQIVMASWLIPFLPCWVYIDVNLEHPCNRMRAPSSPCLTLSSSSLPSDSLKCRLFVRSSSMYPPPYNASLEQQAPMSLCTSQPLTNDNSPKKKRKKEKNFKRPNKNQPLPKWQKWVKRQEEKDNWKAMVGWCLLACACNYGNDSIMHESFGWASTACNYAIKIKQGKKSPAPSSLFCKLWAVLWIFDVLISIHIQLK